MTNTKNYWRVVALAFVGLALVGVGLWLAVLSDPKRFSISVADDRSILFFSLSGVLCTLAGIGLFLYAVRHTTQSMPAQLQRNANIGVALGFVFQLFGLFLPDILHVPSEIGLALMLLGFPAFVWGAMNYCTLGERMAVRETGLAKKMALREAGDSQKPTSFPESQGWLSVNDLTELRKLDMETNRPSRDTIAANVLGSGIRIAE